MPANTLGTFPAPNLIGDSAAPYVLLQQTVDQIGTIFPDVVLEEICHDTLVITRHPVMNGCPVSDHAYKVPPTVQLKIGFSDSSHQEPGYVQKAYAALVSLQEALTPFDVFTSKRAYSNMLISNIMVVTDRHSMWVLNAIVTCEYLRIAGQAAVPLRLIPETTTPVSGAGEVAPKEAPGVTPPPAVAGTGELVPPS